MGRELLSFSSQHPEFLLIGAANLMSSMTLYTEGGVMRLPGEAKNVEKCGRMHKMLQTNVIQNAVVLQWCMPAETPMFIKTHVNLLTP